MAAISGLTDRQRRRFQAMRESGQGNLARQFRKRMLRQNKAQGTEPGAMDGIDKASGGSLFGGEGNVKLGPKLSNQLQKGAAVGQALVDKFLPDISVLGTLDPTRTDETQNLINQQAAFANQAGQRSADMAAAISRAERGLGGLTAVENEALREQGFEGIARNFQQGQRALARLGNRPGAEGQQAALLRDIARDTGQARRGLERDILLQNIAIQDQRRNALANLIAGTEQQEFARGQSSLQQLQGLTTQAQLAEEQRQKFNLQQQANLLAGQQGLFFGGMGLFEGKKNALANQRAQEEAQALAEANAAAQAAAYQQQSLALQNLMGGVSLPSFGGGIV